MSDAVYSSELFTNDAIDSFDCVVAFHHCWQMYSIDNVTYNCINEHVLSERRYQEDFDDNTIGYFVLNDFENIEVNSSILQLKFLSNINICNIQNIDIPYFIKNIFKRENIFECSFLNMNIEQNIDALFQIPHLISLAFIKSKVKTLPTVIDAPHLESLNFFKITEFPSYLLKDAQRETINVSFNEITTFELDSVPEDSKLTSLNLDNNQLSSLPEGLEQFAYLERLSLSKNQLTSIPIALFRHQKLKNFSFSHNKIEFLPNNLSKMKNLDYLSFDSNQIKALPMMLPLGIKKCDYQHNPITKEDAEIFELLFPEGLELPF